MATVPDSIHLLNGIQDVYGTSRLYRIILIPGNPGVVDFYSSFLSSLHLLLQRSSIIIHDDIKTEIVGRSLGGFETAASSWETKWHNEVVTGPLGLQEQIRFLQDFILSIDDPPNTEPPPLILIGHSVGAYILLELVRRFAPLIPGAKPSIRIAGGICLFPTVVDIARSTSGRKFGWLLRLPGFAVLIAIFIKLLVWMLPDRVLSMFVRYITKFPEDAISTIIAFLRSPQGVRQALHMAGDEMRQIAADSWGESVWGSSNVQPPKLFFYFGRVDHWVADETREDLITKHAYQEARKQDWKPRMTIDELSIPHSFCISNSFQIAQVCSKYVEHIIMADQ